MNARDELALELFIADNHAQPREQSIVDWEWFNATERFRGRIEHYKVMALGVIDAGYRKPRTITTFAELEALPFGSAVQTSDDSDTVVLRSEGEFFRNQSGADVDWTTLWRHGTHPFTVLYEPGMTA